MDWRYFRSDVPKPPKNDYVDDLNSKMLSLILVNHQLRTYENDDSSTNEFSKLLYSLNLPRLAKSMTITYKSGA